MFPLIGAAMSAIGGLNPIKNMANKAMDTATGNSGTVDKNGVDQFKNALDQINRDVQRNTIDTMKANAETQKDKQWAEVAMNQMNAATDVATKMQIK